MKMIRLSPPPPPPSSNSKIVDSGKKNFLSTWFPQWWYSTSLTDSQTPEINTRLTSLDEDIIDVFAGSSDTTFLKRDVVFGHFNFSLKQGTINLCTAIFEHKKIQ